MYLKILKLSQKINMAKSCGLLGRKMRNIKLEPREVD